MLDACWHEWGHRDVQSRTDGELINNPDIFFYSPISDKNELWKEYRGQEVFTETHYGFLRLEEVVNETITVRMMIERVGLESVISAADYYRNGVDFFVKLTQKMNISLNDLYRFHSTSDFEGLAKLIGEKLPGNQPALNKGAALFLGIHRSDLSAIEQTGALEMIK